MQPPPPAGRVYGFRCVRCGNGLELPRDMRLLHIDCPFCGQDNLLPPDVVQARQRQYELEQHHYALHLQEQERQRALQAKALLHRQSAQRLMIFLALGGLLAAGLFGSCVAIGYYASKEEDATKARAQDPKINGHSVLLARLAQLRDQQGCSRILVQPTTHSKEPGSISLDMVKNDHCVHVLAATGTPSLLSMKYDGKVALTQPLPASAPLLDYRLCASETASHSFKIEAVPVEPFSAAAVECPRTPAEGGVRSSADDSRKTGKDRVQSMLNELVQAGCKTVLSEPKVSRGEQTFTVTSPANAACYNMLAASFFSDVRLSAVLIDPTGKNLPVPEPGSQLRIEYCAPKAGEYKLVVTPSSGDYFAHASVDCNRFGPQGLRRRQKLQK